MEAKIKEHNVKEFISITLTLDYKTCPIPKYFNYSDL